VLLEKVLSAFREGVDTVAIDVALNEAYIAVKEIDGITFAHLVATGRQSGSGIDRGAIKDCLPYENGQFAFLGHDDQHWIKVFDCWGDTRLVLVSDGASLGGSVAGITVDYPQRGFSNEELEEYRRLDDAGEAIGDREQRAITEWDNAISVGMRQVFGWTSGVAYLDVCYERAGYHARTGELVDIPTDALPLVAFWPNDSDWRWSKLEQRDY